MATDKLTGQAIVEVGEPAATARKKPYRAPLLTAYGHISKLTMAQAGSGADGGRVASRMRAACL